MLNMKVGKISCGYEEIFDMTSLLYSLQPRIEQYVNPNLRTYRRIFIVVWT